MPEQNSGSDCSLPAGGNLRACAAVETDPFDDMHDNQADWDRYSSLLPLEGCCKLSAAFDRADGEAVKYQSRHRLVTKLAAGVATLAVVLAISGLGILANNTLKGKPGAKSSSNLEEIIDRSELWAAGLTVSMVALGYLLGWKEKWLRQRHRAELYRLLRYNFLIRPSVWTGDGDAESWIKSQLERIDNLTAEGDLEKALNEPSPPGPYEPTNSRMPRHQLQALTQYYLTKRLGPQKEYLANRVQRNEIKDWLRLVLPWFFFGSILAVVAKSFLESHYPSWWFALILAATLLPVFAAGIRTYLAAFEFSRNKSRFHAAHKALLETEKSLMTNTFAAVNSEASRPRQEAVFMSSHLAQVIVMAEHSGTSAESSQQAETDAYPVLRDLAWSEHILDAEHREWLRLMYDAEWFG